MLTGGRVFAGEGVADFIVSVLTKDPDWTSLPAGTPPRVVELLKRCLRKDARERLRDIGDARIELEGVLAGGRDTRADAPTPTSTGTPLWKVIAVLAVMAAAGMAAWMLSHRGAESAPALTRTTVLLPPGQELDAVQTTAPLALSTDGRRLAYVASSGGNGRVLRGLDAPTLRRSRHRRRSLSVFSRRPVDRVFADAKLSACRFRQDADGDL
jgi:serine/threonine-protein kinase